MAEKYSEYKGLNLPKVAQEVLEKWSTDNTFAQSVDNRNGQKPFVFYEGPPSANGMPGIHHVMARAIKDTFCRYKTLKGYQVERKAGWDTHGLPVELGVEKELGITKEDIGKSISIEEYNKACREAVMRYTDVWNDLTMKMGYWVDMDDPYVTYENKYIETVWWLLSQLESKGLMYKGYTIQPYSPAAGTGLSTHELNQPGCYKNVKDTSAIAFFNVKEESVAQVKEQCSSALWGKLGMIAWTTTPWTLPSNTALCVGPKIDYVIINTYNQYSGIKISLVMAENLVSKYFNAEHEGMMDEAYEVGAKVRPYEIVGKAKGADLVGVKYEQLLAYTQPHENPEEAFRVISGDFVTTEDGTGIVHVAPTFGQDDAMVAKAAGVPPMLVLDEHENLVPLVDLQGRFRPEMGELAGKYVKNEYYAKGEAPDRSIDVEISIKLKEEDKAFLVAKYEHSYPHCWRTDKPVLYYPLDSWFIRTTEVKDRLIALNKTINWKPKATGEGRFGNWLENLNDWNLSRSRFWGIPIPIWRTEDGSEMICIGSVEQLKKEIGRSIEAGLMMEDPLADFEPGNMSKENYTGFDLHKNHVDKVILVSESGKAMKRESDLIDVWFDSGSMPFAQLHYPFENKELVDEGKAFPADFIAEGVDQTRGWFFTLHAIGTMCFDSVAYKNVMSNGLVLDKNGQKMSKRLGNAADPFKTLDEYGPDATRWYMLSNAQPWDNLKFDLDGITEVQRKFFGTLYNTYGFFSLYANIDGFKYEEEGDASQTGRELDRWIISKLHSLIAEVDAAYDDYEPTRAARAIQSFTVDQLSNWYVRLSRRIFWKGEYTAEKKAAYRTLYTCLETIAILSSPIAPFYMDRLYSDLVAVTGRGNSTSVHLTDMPQSKPELIDPELEAKMEIAQKVSSLVLSLRKKEKLKVRQPLQKIMIPLMDESMEGRIEHMKDLIISEVNVKEIEYLDKNSNTLVKNIKADFKALGPRFGKQMKAVAAQIAQFGQEEISQLESQGSIGMEVDGETVMIQRNEVEISSQDIPGWLVASDGPLTVALDISLTEELKNEGIARELVNRVQNIRKEKNFEVTDRIKLAISADAEIRTAINENKNYICAEILAESLDIVESIAGEEPLSISLLEGDETMISVVRSN